MGNNGIVNTAKSQHGEDKTSPAERLAELCATTLESATGEVADSLASIARRLTEPLRVVVAGGVSSGKSTLVNALIGHRVAAVDAGECTRVVTEFRYGHPERAEAIEHDGTKHPVSLVGKALPSELPIASERIERVVVYLSNALLERMIIVDTPGVNTVTGSNQTAAERALGLATTDAMAAADAVVFLTPHAREADAAILDRVIELGRDSGLTSANCIAVLSKVDLLSDGIDALVSAERLVATTGERLHGRVSDVVPLVGLMAETIEAGRFTEADASTVAAIAAVEDELDREDMLLTAQDLIEWPDLAASPQARRQLVELLGMYGIKTAVDLFDAGVAGAAALSSRLLERSGFSALRNLLLQRFETRSQILKAHSAIQELRDISYSAGTEGRRLRRQLERIELDPAMTELGLIDAVSEFADKRSILPTDLARQLDTMTTSTVPTQRLDASAEDLPDVALRSIAAWAGWANDPRRSPDEARAANAVKKVLEVIWTTSASTSEEPQG